MNSQHQRFTKAVYRLGATALAAFAVATGLAALDAPEAYAKKTKAATGAAPVASATAPINLASDPNFAKVNKLAAAGQYAEASKILFQMSRSSRYVSENARIQYVLGLMLYEMKLNQGAAFLFYDVIHEEGKSASKSKYLRQSLEQLAKAADLLDSDVLLRYAMKQVNEADFPVASRDMLSFRTGELKMQEKQYMDAAREFAKVKVDTQYFLKARYRLGLALTEAGELEKAQSTFEDLIDRTKSLGVTHPMRVGALLGKARVLYQRKLFAASVVAYRDVPRDTEQWHEALFESTWAMLQDGQFRNALSNFHSLHSPFYQDYYQPESLMLRAIVYLYICRYDEMEKVLDLYGQIYKPVAQQIKTLLDSSDDPAVYYNEITRYLAQPASSHYNSRIPHLVAREIAHEGDVRRTFNYLANLESERRRIDAQPSSWRLSSLGLYVKKIVERRIEATRVLAGRQIRRHLVIVGNELQDLFEQDGFLRFEMLSGKKEALRKEIAGKGLGKTQVDQNNERDFYIQNGYEYWPFKGEYWLDEIGNYHYVGVKACE